MKKVEWIAADWGTSNLRLWAMNGMNVLDRRSSGDGMSGLRQDEFAGVLARMTEGWPDTPVVACGMVGARQGWIEAPYNAVPLAAVPQLVRVPGHRVWIVCGVRQDDPPDVMRGEETQIAGLVAARPNFDGTICLPGTHTKWARISAGEICSFQSFMTGEIFALLSQQSVLRHSVGDADDPDAFDAAVADAMTQPHRAFGRLFQLRAGALVGDLSPPTAGARLSGTLIGLELAGAKPYWLGQEICVIGAPKLSALYRRALEKQGVACSEGDAEATTLAGLYSAWTRIGETA